MTLQTFPQTLRRPLFAVLAWSLLFLAVSPEAEARKKKDPKAVINGRVLTQAEEPLKGVQVTIRGADFEEERTTDKEGNFSVEITNPTGSYSVHFAKDGYAPFQTDLAVTPDEVLNFDFRLLDAETGRKQDAIRIYNEGAQAFTAGDKATAKEAFLKAKALDPSLAEPHLGLADIYLGEELYAEAAEAAEAFLAIKPGQKGVQQLAYEAWRKIGDEAKIEEYRKLLAEDTEVASQLAVQVFNEGAIASQGGDLDLAVEKFKAALDLDPKLQQAWSALATMYYNKEAYADALGALEKVLELDATNAQGLRIRYLIHDALDASELSASLDAYAAVDGKGAADLLYQRADLDFRGGEPDTAKKALERVLELDPEYARAYYTLGLIHASTDTAKAKELLQKFIEMAPDDPEVGSARDMISYF